MYYIVSAAIFALIVWKIYDVLLTGKKEAKENAEIKAHEKEIRELEEQIRLTRLITYEQFQQLEEQEKVRILNDWEIVWPSVKAKLENITEPHIRSLLADGLSTVGTFEAVMNELNWNYLLEGARHTIPPTGRIQINETVQNVIDRVRDEMKNN